MSRARYPSSPDLNRRLSIIDEDEVRPAQIKHPKASHRPFNRRWRDDPPRHSFEAPPPQYNVWDDVQGPRGEKLKELRNHRHVVRRGGWRRLLLIFLLVLAILVALGVGLGIGLARRYAQNRTQSESNSESTPGPFPAGFYSISTYLTQANTNCTSNPATWRCFPYTTYGASPPMSAVTFFWNISHVAENNTFAISSSNPFSVNFANASLSLLDAGTADERYHFSMPTDQTVIPASSITTDNTMASCDFKSTTLEGSLYTKRPHESQSTNATRKAVEQWEPWNYAVELTQRVGGGEGVPSCYKTFNGQKGAVVTDGLVPKLADDLCECSYKNFDL